MKKYYITLASLGIIFLISVFILYNNKKIYFSLNGDAVVNINIGEKYKEEGFKAQYCSKYVKIFCKDINNKVNITKNIRNSKHYFINYNLEYKNNSKVLTREIINSDIESPVIELVEDDSIVCPNQIYKEPGYKAYDNVDGDITKNVIREVRDKKVYYSVIDSSGNKKIVYRNISYKDNEVPEITLVGGDIEYIFKNTKYTDNGIIAIDNCDGNISEKVNVDSNLDTSKNGEYEIIYTISDNSGNKATKKKKVVVYDDLSKVPKNGKIIYLTFDDGPGSYTEDILKILDKYNVKATFFVTNQFSSYQNLIKKEYEKGHTIAIHTYSHKYDKIYSSADEFINDFNNMNQVILEQTGTTSKIFRFPGGSSNTISTFNKGIMTELTNKMTELGYVYFDWNIDSEDTMSDDAHEVFQNVKNGIEKKDVSVVLMHDIKKVNIESLDLILNYGLKNGYTFLPLKNDTPPVHHTVNN